MLKSVSSVANSIGALNYKGTWNASTNTPTLTSSVGTKGDYYVVSVAGATSIDGVSNWGVGDWIAFNGSTWQRVEGGADLNGVNLSVSGTMTFTGTGNRIIGDFTNATIANRVAFQTSTANTATTVLALPSGSGTTASWDAYNNSDPTNSSYLGLSGLSTETRLSSAIRGTGTYLPMNFFTGGSERVRIDTSGNVGVGATANASAILDAQSTTKGVRFPNMTTAQKNAIATPAAGLVIFDTTLSKLCVYSGAAWQTITSV